MLKDYYKTLGVPPAATSQEVKAAFRVLAARYHPDKAVDNPFAESHFKEIVEAYGVLSDNQSRYAYDEERWLRGISTRARDKIRISPEWLLAEVRKLAVHMESIDRHRMNHAALRNYALLLLSDEHMSIWQQEANAAQDEELINKMLSSIQRMRLRYYQPVSERLSAIFQDHSSVQARLETELRQKRINERFERALPFIAVLVAVLICAVIVLIR